MPKTDRPKRQTRVVILFIVAVGLTLFGYLSGSFDPDLVDALTRQKIPKAKLVSLEEVFSAASIKSPTEMVPIPGTGKFLMTEQGGDIKLLDPESDAPAPTIHQIGEKLSTGGEKGLLGLALHPKFQENGYLFVDYVAKAPLRTVVSRLTFDPESQRVLTDSEQVILEVEQPASNHNGGKIAFGPDGMLYIALGDGGKGGDPWGNAQNRKTLLGSILRIDVDNKSDGQEYAIPADNPYKDSTEGFRPEIWAYGLRNPWRFSFDSQTGEMWAGDVGQNKYEEIDVIVRGGNYGWNLFEGKSRYGPEDRKPTGQEIEPVFDYPRSEGRSVTGGFVYRGKDLQGLQGRYLCGDFLSGKVWSLGSEYQPKLLLDTRKNISSFAQDDDGELYLLTYPGQVYKITPLKTK